MKLWTDMDRRMDNKLKEFEKNTDKIYPTDVRRLRSTGSVRVGLSFRPAEEKHCPHCDLQ